MNRSMAAAYDPGVSDEFAAMFDLAPISLWVEDFSGVKRQFAAWRTEGVTDLGQFLRADPSRVHACASLIRVIGVNQRTLQLFEAANRFELVANLDQVFRDDMLMTHVDELVQLWNTGTAFKSQTVNYTLSGRRLDILLNAIVLPGYEDDWSRVLVAIDDVTEREVARRELAESDAYARSLFDLSPVSLWVEDFSHVKRLIDEVRGCGIDDFRTFTDVHPEFVDRCMSEIRIIDVNRETIRIFCAADRTELLMRKHEIFRDAMRQPFREQLIDLWNGKLFQQREVVNYSLEGHELHFLLQFSVLAGHEHDWSLVQVALTDITARKKAEAYLEFLGKHDVLTKLYNRSFYVDEIARLQRSRLEPMTIIIADLNGLKVANDRMGHAVGDQMLRRAGEILAAAVEAPATAARIGGDEFAILMPSADERGGQAMMENIRKLVELNNQFYGGMPLSFAMGAATGAAGEPLEQVAKRADELMYEEKRQYYAQGAGAAARR
ncbi:diguanylate cyclase domain-containing protein [Methyloraptor flagellatus]|uniref:GGDEF domain-containing protein n=1 Tax=Methyloraptor flagellatus TaxID=3162530 RepID=A0AAU7X9F9_9HYPH